MAEQGATEPAAEGEAVPAAEAEPAPPRVIDQAARERALAEVFQGNAETMSLWNGGAIDWVSYEEGLTRAAAENRPAIVVVKTGWCPRCNQYSRSFSNDAVVAASEEFVMILADQDHVPAVRQNLAPDGGYVPRTHFLAPDGTPDDTLTSGRSDYAYFINPSDPAALVALMVEARQKYP